MEHAGVVSTLTWKSEQIAEVEPVELAQRTGELVQDGWLVADGYSGGDTGKNNPDTQAVHNAGPIPQGGGSIEGPPINTAKTWALRTALGPRLWHRHVRTEVSSSRATQRSLQDALLRRVQSENNGATAGMRNWK